MIKKITLISALTAALAPTISMAGALDDFKTELNKQFKPIAQDVIGSQSHKTFIPAEPLGLIGFDIGVTYNSASLNSSLKDMTYSGLTALDSLTVSANKGLPLGVDVGVNYSVSPMLTTLNGTLSYAILDGGMALPAVTVKGTYTTALDATIVDFTSYGADIGVSKGFANITPFASAGFVSGEVSTVDTTLASASYSETVMRYAVGVNVNILIADILVAYNTVGDVSTTSAKLGFRF